MLNILNNAQKPERKNSQHHKGEIRCETAANACPPLSLRRSLSISLTFII